MWRSNRWRAEAIRWCRMRWSGAARTARLAIGIPDYEAYVAHLAAKHPERTPLDRDAFFQERMLARYGKRHTRCC